MPEQTELWCYNAGILKESAINISGKCAVTVIAVRDVLLVMSVYKLISKGCIRALKTIDNVDNGIKWITEI